MSNFHGEDSPMEERFKAALEHASDSEMDITELGESGLAQNEYYESMVKSGFTPRQALYLTAAMVTGNPGLPPPQM